MVGHHITSVIKPELAHLGEHFALVGDLIFQDVIKRRDAVRGNHDEAVAIVVNFADFAFLDGLKLCHSKTLLFLV